jgi:hypothetical protein
MVFGTDVFLAGASERRSGRWRTCGRSNASVNAPASVARALLLAAICTSMYAHAALRVSRSSLPVRLPRQGAAWSFEIVGAAGEKRCTRVAWACCSHAVRFSRAQHVMDRRAEAATLSAGSQSAAKAENGAPLLIARTIIISRVAARLGTRR